MILSDFHVHSSFSDGDDSPETVVLQAIKLGMTRLGFSDHSYAPYDIDCCIPEDRIGVQLSEIRRLRKKYKEQISIFCGIEHDIYSETPTDAYDYVIGSVHYLQLGDEYCAVDWKPEMIKKAAEDHFSGDMNALAEEYYRTLARVYEKTGCDIIGHFDLITKFNERFSLFDTASASYISAWKGAADKLLEAGRPFEINTGAISRSWRTSPYPSADICRYISENGGTFVLSSDAHSAESLCCGFAEWEKIYSGLGFKITEFCI